MLCTGVISAGGAKAQPFVGLQIVAFDALSGGIHFAEIVLGPGVSPVSGLLEPIPRLGVILRDGFAVVVEQRDEELRAGVSVLGERTPFLHCRGIIVLFI